MLATSLRAISHRPGRVRALCLAVVLAGGLSMLFGGQSVLSSALGRGDKMSGRRDIWAAVIAAAGNPVIGTGFESFWNANVSKVNQTLDRAGFLDMSDLNSAHNGYLQIYLDLGLVGVCLIALILISGYRHASRAFQQNPEVASLMLTYITTATFYNISEAGFRTLTPNWIFLLVAVVGASGCSAGYFADVTRPVPAWQRSLGATASNTLEREKQAVYTASGSIKSRAIDNSLSCSHTIAHPTLRFPPQK